MHAAKGGSGPRNSTRTTPQAPPWWTDADQAELDRVLWEFVACVDAHKPADYYWPDEAFRGCRDCWERDGWCPALTETWKAIEHWLYGRRLAAKAEWLRRRALEQILAELRAGREEAA